jgi:NADPH-dependent ferric siderophore reductase
MSSSLRPLTVFPITTRTLEVLRVADVTSGMRRVTLGGPELAAHTATNGYPVAAFRSDGFDDEFKILLHHPDAPEPVGPTQADGVLNWPRGDEHLLLRTYTVRRWDPQAGEIDVDFVKHGVGPATSWACRVQPGERMQIAGPKMSAPHPNGADWVLIAGDETALPAIGRWLEEWPAGARAQVFIEIAEPQHRQQLPEHDGVEVTWLSRDGAEPGTTTLLFDAIRSAEWWPGTVFAWVAGETLTLTPIRRWLRNEQQLSKSQVDVTGYWRRREVVLTDDDATVQDLEASQDEGARFHELSELLPGFAVRIAATLGLAAAFDGGEQNLDSLASRTGCDRHGLAKLLRYLAALDVVEPSGGGFRLTSLGRELEDDDVMESLHLERAHAARELAAALSLLAAVRDGAGDHVRWFGQEWLDRSLAPGVLLDERIEHEAEDAVYVAGALAEASAFSDRADVAIIGEGAASLAASLASAHSAQRITILAAPSEIEAMQRLHGDHDRVRYEPAGPLSGPEQPVDAVLLSGALARLADADAVHLLRRAALGLAQGGSVLVFSEVLDPALADEHDYEHDLIGFALTGGGARDDEEHRRLFEAASLSIIARSTIGWGYTLYELTRNDKDHA